MAALCRYAFPVKFSLLRFPAEWCKDIIRWRKAVYVPLARKARLDTKILCRGDFHEPKHTTIFYL